MKNATVLPQDFVGRKVLVTALTDDNSGSFDEAALVANDTANLDISLHAHQCTHWLRVVKGVPLTVYGAGM